MPACDGQLVRGIHDLVCVLGLDGKPLTFAVELEGNKTLRLTIANPPFLPGREWRTVLTRVE